MLRRFASLWKSLNPSRKPARKSPRRERLLLESFEPRMMFAGDFDQVFDDDFVVASSSVTSSSAPASQNALVEAVNTTNIDQAIEAGLQHLQNILDSNNHNIPFFYVWAMTSSQTASYGDSQTFRDSRAHLGFERHLVSNSAGRATYALLLGADAIGAQLNSGVMDTLTTWVLKSLHKPRNGNWNDTSAANQMITGIASDPRSYGSTRFDLTHLFNIGAGLRGALGLATLDDDAAEIQPGYQWSSRTVFEVAVHNLRQYYVYGGNPIGGERVYNWEVLRNQLGLQGGDAWTGTVSSEINSNWSGIWRDWSNPFLIHDLVKYYEATGHQSSLDLAKELRDHAFYNIFPRNPEQVPFNRFTHMFEITAEMNAFSRLALVTGDADMMERVRVRYEALRGVGFNSTGWVPEFLNRGSDVGEVNNTAELIETALNFAEFGWTEYYQDVERFTRGHVLPSQLLDTSFVVPNNNPANDGQRNIQQTVYGAFGFPAPYGHVATRNPSATGGYHVDITAGAVATLAEIKKAIHRFHNGAHEINLLFDFSDSQIDITSPYPEGDRLTITTRVAGDVRLRLPTWADRSAVAASLTQQGLQFSILSDSVRIHQPQVGRQFYVAMPLPFVRATDRVNGRNITIDWRGDSVFAMSTMGTPLPFFANVTSTPPASTPPSPTPPPPTPAANQPPVVNAGADRTVELGVGLALAGTATDDGLPAIPGTLSVGWSKALGPGTVTFSHPNSRNTSVQFSVAGEYVLRFSASDGHQSRSNDLTVTVTNSLQPITTSFQDGVFPTIQYAGTRDTKISSTAPVYGHGKVTKLSIDGSPDMAALMAWDISLIPQGSTVVSAAIELFVTNGTKDSYEIYALERAWEELAATWHQFASGRSWSEVGASGAADADATALGFLTARQLGFQQIALNQAGLDLVQAWIDEPADNHGIIFQDYLNGNDNSEFSSRETPVASQRPKLVVTYIPGPANGGGEEDPPPVIDPPATNQSPQANAGVDQTIQLPGSAALSAIVTDDGLPAAPGTVSTIWSKSSGPGTVTFGNAGARSTTASFSTPGTYVLRIVANDGQLQASDDVTIVVQPAPVANQPPQVNAGVNQTIQLPASASLVGTVTDDGLPASPGAVATAWSKVSGPGTVNFGNAGAKNTTASFSAPGTYVLRLAAHDGQFQVSDELTIVVQPAPVANQPPQVNAGVDQTIQLPAAANLAGTASDDSQPASPGAVTTNWSRISGPGSVSFANAASRNTTASFSAAGTYVLRLTASDGQLQSIDELTVTVIPPLVQHQPPTVSAGPDLQASVDAVANLGGTVTFTTPARPITVTWTLTLGPAAVRYGSPSSLNTTVEFTNTGTYILRLTVSDGQFSVFDEVTVTVVAKGDKDGKRRGK